MTKKIIFFDWLILSVILTVIIAEYKGNEWEETIRKGYYNSVLTKDSIPAEFKISIDSCGIPYVNYYKRNGITIGKQYNPTIISNYALQYYTPFDQSKNSETEKYFYNCAQWLINNLTYTDDYALYIFNWQAPFYPQLQTPWTSGIASGSALKVFVYAYKNSHSEKYLEVSKRILKGFYVPIEQGGFSCQTDSGWWFEEYADKNAKGPHVLNGHVSALLGIYDFYRITKNDSAFFLFQQGIKALKHSVHLYDQGENNWSYYDIYKKPADKKYQRTIVKQMKQLYAITGDSTFYNYCIKWETPLKEPYLIRIVKEKNRSGGLLVIGLWAGIIIAGICIRKLFCNKSPS
ncbi:MAG: hypothetical protein HY840_11235 [Bacteroidetes bacterium]|nr:hypothetical protein [Bacteroidota bacterium]